MGEKTIVITSGDRTITNGTTYYALISGYISVGTEAYLKHKIYGTLYLTHLFVRITSNSINGSTTIRTRKNEANGQMSVSVGSTETGTFEDTTNFDSLAADDYINYQIVAGGSSGTLSLSILSCCPQNSTGITLLNTAFGYSQDDELTRYFFPQASLSAVTTESDGQARAYASMTWDNLAAYISSNTINATSSITARSNETDQTMALSIGAKATGEFEDTSDTVSLSNHRYNYSIVTPAQGGTKTMTIYKIQSRLTGAYSPHILHVASGAAGTEYYSLQGVSSYTESDVQVKIRGASSGWTAYDMWTWVISCTITGFGLYLRNRENGSNGGMVINVPFAGSGLYTDIGSDSMSNGMLYNLIYAPDGGSGSATMYGWGLEFSTPSVTSPPPYSREFEEAFTVDEDYSRLSTFKTGYKELITLGHFYRQAWTVVRQYFENLTLFHDIEAILPSWTFKSLEEALTLEEVRSYISTLTVVYNEALTIAEVHTKKFFHLARAAIKTIKLKILPACD